ncbi:unnamed protein product [Rotaria sp. Silwood2]|nr:unnamed protein product [Rotaria sp. Silwood2]CAF3890765.1 unnamed protein product [Rotaria sp. Silwood2]
MSMIDTVYLKDGRASVPLKGVMDLIDSLLEIRFKKAIVNSTNPNESIAIWDNRNDQNISDRFRRTEFITTKTANLDGFEDSIKSLRACHISTSTETIFSLCNLKLLMDQLNSVLKTLQNESSEAVCNASQGEHPKNYWAWRLERTINVLQSTLEAEERK